MARKFLTDEEKDLTREEILESATYLISTKGHNLFSIRTLANSLDMSATNIYNYYLNRDAILLNVFERGYNLILEYKSAAYNKGKDPIDGIKNVLWSIYDFSINNYHIYDTLYLQKDVINTEQFYGTELEELVNNVTSSLAHSYDFWNDILKEALPNESEDSRKIITIQIGSMIHGALRYYHIRKFSEHLVEPLKIVSITIQHILDNLECKSNWGVIK